MASRPRTKEPLCESVYNLVDDGNYNAVNVLKATTHTPASANGPRSGTSVKVRSHHDSSQLQGILNPVRGIRDAQKRAGVQPTNHARQNRAAIKERSQMNALRKLQENETDSGAGRSQPQKAVKVVPRRRSCSDSGHGRDFVKENIATSASKAESARKKRDGGADNWLEKSNYGRIPEYLHERKIELAAHYAAQQAAKEAELVPPGMRIMGDDERIETLHMLEKNKTEVEKQLAQLPFVIETPSLKRLKGDLEKRLDEIAKAVTVFSRQKVIVKA